MEQGGEYIEAVEAPSTSNVSSDEIIQPRDPEPKQEERVIPLEEQEKEAIKKALIVAGGRRKEAAESLGISERTLYRKIKEYGLEK
jgi:DNA-binding NtrC family response regulator